MKWRLEFSHVISLEIRETTLYIGKIWLTNIIYSVNMRNEICVCIHLKRWVAYFGFGSYRKKTIRGQWIPVFHKK